MKIKVVLGGMSMLFDNVKFNGITMESDQLYSIQYEDADGNDRWFIFPLRELVYMTTSEPKK